MKKLSYISYFSEKTSSKTDDACTLSKIIEKRSTWESIFHFLTRSHRCFFPLGNFFQSFGKFRCIHFHCPASLHRTVYMPFVLWRHRLRSNTRYIIYRRYYSSLCSQTRKQTLLQRNFLPWHDKYHCVEIAKISYLPWSNFCCINFSVDYPAPFI